ncbi:MAG: EAL domain-containing protein, partial [Aestuariivirga sp.]
HSYPEALLTMNVSAATAMDPHWYDQLLDVIRTNGQAANRLTVEITETVALNDLQSSRRFVDQLRQAGCNVAIDDFGAGYTSLRNLRELPVNILKFDGSFCRDLENNRDNQYMVRSLIDLSNKFNLKTVAEWVETRQDSELLRAWGIDYVQGNYHGAASIIPPWGEPQVNIFDVSSSAINESIAKAASDPTSLEVFSFAIPRKLSIDTSPPMPADLEVVTNTLIQEMSEAIAAVQPEISRTLSASTADDLTTEAPLLDFSDIDQSITNLRAALSDLTIAKELPPSEEFELTMEADAA